MSHTDSTAVLAKAIYDLLVLNQDTLGLKDVLYGNQLMIPRSPTAVVLAGTKRRDLEGVSAPGGRTRNWLTVYIDIHDSKVLEETLARQALDALAEKVEKKLHEDVTMGGIIIHGFVNVWDPGESFIQNGMFRSVRMTYIGQTKTYLSA